jgi:serine/threonine protein phosphatase PrpC
MSLAYHGVCDLGSVRTQNEDRVLLDESLGLFAVCDGMGGHQHGEVAAELAIAAMRYYIEASRDRLDVTWPFGYDFRLSVDANRLVTSFRLANRQVWRRAEETLEYAGMGTTVAAVLLNGSSLVAANIGDSRIYRLRAGELTQLSVDDTIINTMSQRGLLNPSDAPQHPLRNILTQAAGSQESIEVHVREEAQKEGDVILLSSDGLHGVVGDAAIRSVLNSGASTQQCARDLLEAARSGGAPDNVSVVVLRYS